MFDSIRKRASSWAIIIVFGIIILVFIFSGIGNMNSRSGMVVAEVNGENITVHEYSARLSRFLQQQQQYLPEIKTAADIKAYGLDTLVLRDMIQERLLEQFAAELGIFVTDRDLLAELAQVPFLQNSDGKLDKKKVEEWLKSREYTWGQFAAERRKPLLAEKISDYLSLSVGVTPDEARRTFDFIGEERTAQYVLFPLDEYKAKVNPTDEQVNQYYEANQAAFRVPASLDVSSILLSPAGLTKNYPVSDDEAKTFYDTAGAAMFTSPARFKISHILIADPAGAAPGPLQEEKAKEVSAKLKSGGDFAELARTESVDRATAERGGEIGVIEIGPNMFPEYAEALGAMKVGEISEPVRTERGFFIIRLDDKVEPRLAPYAEVEAPIKERLALQKAAAAFDDVRHEVEGLLSAKTGLDEIAARFGIAVNNSGLKPEATVLESLKLPAESVQILVGTPAGELVPVPLDTEDGFIVVKVNQARPEGVLPLADVKDGIVDVIKNQEGMLLARQAAAAAMPEFEGKADVPAAWKGKVQDSGVFHRGGAVVGLGSSPSLVEALFGARSGEWLSAPYEAETGMVIARVTEVIPASERQWGEVQGQVIQGILAEKQRGLTLFMMESLWNKAKVNVNTEVLNTVLSGNK